MPPPRPPEPLESSMSTGAASHPANTARLTFRSWRAEDEALALGLWGDPRVTALIDARGKLGADEVRRRLEVEIQRELEHGIQYWPIFLRDTGEHVGCCGLRPYDPARRILELGFHMRGDHWGKGLATEAARSVIAHAFSRLGVSALFAGHHPGNAASRRTLEKLGFHYTHDEPYAPTGLNHPSYLLTRP
jgi:ribosomal-protein-alanine N-acetyltransferase